MGTVTSGQVVVVGASVAGLRAAEGLRKAGFAGEVVVVGAEPHMPYDRPPLSKRALRDGPTAHDLALRVPKAARDCVWRLGVAAVDASIEDRVVALADGSQLEWDGLVVATGLRARRLDLVGPDDGRYALRSLDDAAALAKALEPGSRVVVLGAGFVGCEVAATAREIGAEVDVVAPEAEPLEHAIGRLLGAALRRRHERHGVRFHLGTTAVALEGGATVTGVRLADGSRLRADVVVEAVGSEPVVDWLGGTGLDLGDGLLCDDQLRVEGHDDVVACGDVARIPDPFAGGAPRRVEHWTSALESGRRAGRTLGGELVRRAARAAGQVDVDGGPSALLEGPPMLHVASFWSDQYDVSLQSFGSPELGTEDVRVLEGALDGDPLDDTAVGYYRDGALVGIVMSGLADRQVAYRDRLLSTLGVVTAG